MESVVKNAITIAKNELRVCYSEHGILAGRHHFTDYWARDAFFASFGSLAIGDREIVERLVEFFFAHQRTDGLLPYRILNSPVTVGKYFGLKPTPFREPKPTYKLRGYGPIVLDGTTLGVLLLSELGLMGWERAEHYYSHACRALEFLRRREKHDLLLDGSMAEWIDAVHKFGYLSYSNIIYARCIRRFSEWNYRVTGKRNAPLIQRANSISHALRHRLWNGRYFSDWHDWKRQDYLNPFTNLLAVCWGQTTPSETASILHEVDRAKIGFTIETNVPAYPWWRIGVPQYLAGMRDYQNQGCLWWPPGLAYILAFASAGKKTEATRQLRLMAKKIIDDHQIWECYERDGRPVRRFFYQAERPFAWGAGMFLWAARACGVI